MAKVTYIGIEHGCYYLESIDSKSRKRTNRMEAIENYLHKRISKMKKVRQTETQISFMVGEERLVIRNIEELKQYDFMRETFHKINSLQHPKKVTYFSKTRLAALALSGVVIITGKHFYQESKQEENVTDPSEEIVMLDSESLKEASQKPVLETLENDLSLEKRLKDTSSMQEQYISYDPSEIMLGARVDISKMQDILFSQRGKIIIETANTYGIDPYLLIAKGLTESSLEHEACCPGGSRYNGYGVGAFQLETPDGRTVKAWNYKTGTEENLEITMENAMDFEKNAQGAAMYFQNRLNLYDGNVFLALQSYNYGVGMMKVVIHDYARQQGITEEEVKQNIHDLGWLEIVKDVHIHPNQYYYRVKIDLDETDLNVIADAKSNYVWKHKTYGNDHYVADVLSYYVGIQSQNRNINGTSTITNLKSYEMLTFSEAETDVNQNKMM